MPPPGTLETVFDSLNPLLSLSPPDHVHRPHSTRAEIDAADKGKITSIVSTAPDRFTDDIVIPARTIVGANRAYVDPGVAVFIGDPLLDRQPANIHGLSCSERTARPVAAQTAKRPPIATAEPRPPVAAAAGHVPSKPKMVSALAPLAIANPHNRPIAVASAGLIQQDDFAPAVPHFVIEISQVPVWERLVALRSVVPAIPARDRSDQHTIATDADFRLAVDLQPDIALTFAERHVIACHPPNTELRVRQQSPGHRQQQCQFLHSERSIHPGL